MQTRTVIGFTNLSRDRGLIQAIHSSVEKAALSWGGDELSLLVTDNDETYRLNKDYFKFCVFLGRPKCHNVSCFCEPDATVLAKLLKSILRR